MNSLRVKTGWGSIVLILSLSACSKQERRFSFSHPHKERELIITLDANRSPKDLEKFLPQGSYQIKMLNQYSYLVRFSEQLDLSAMAEKIADGTGIKKIEANQIYQLYDKIPNDPDFNKLYGLLNFGQSAGIAGADIRATQAWDLSTGDAGIRVAIIDSGVDYNHPDLKENMWVNPGESGLDAKGKDKSSNGIDDDGNGFVDDVRGWDFYNNDNDPMDDNSHGTHVAGTIGARGDNGRGVVGVNWQVTMVPIKVFSAAGASSTEVILQGIDYATQLGVAVSNNSWGGGEFSDAMFAAIERHTKAGSLFVAAAGNESTNNDSEAHYPSTYDLDGIIAVASSNRRDKISGFSNYGKKAVDVAAPGEDIYSTTPNNTYGFKSGTSMATPHVAGLAALLKASYPSLDSQAIKAKIMATSVPVASLAAAVAEGRIDAASALENDSTAPGAVVGLELESSGVRDLVVSWAEAGDDLETGKATRYLLRLSPSPVEDEAAWNLAQSINTTALPSSEGRVRVKIAGLAYNTQAYVTVRAVDNVGNVGALAPSQYFELAKIPVLLSLQNDSLKGWEKPEGSWGLARIDEQSALSDSPQGRYENNVNVAVTTEEIAVTNRVLVLDLRSRWALEAGYDFGYVELSRDGGKTWIQLAALTGGSDGWSIQSYPLKDVLGDAESFRIRCRLKTDFSINADGWDIDSLELVTERSQ